MLPACRPWSSGKLGLLGSKSSSTSADWDHVSSQLAKLSRRRTGDRWGVRRGRGYLRGVSGQPPELSRWGIVIDLDEGDDIGGLRAALPFVHDPSQYALITELLDDVEGETTLTL